VNVTDCLGQEGVDGAGCINCKDSLSVVLYVLWFEQVRVDTFEELT